VKKRNFLFNNLLVIVPCYESPEVGEVVRALEDEGFLVLVVDDGSVKINVRQLLAHSKTILLTHPENRGQGAALSTGMAYARVHNFTYVAHFDADGQHHVKDLKRFALYLDSHPVDIVLGSRFMQKTDTQAVPRRKRILLTTGRFVNYLFTSLWLTDAHNGLRIMNKNALAVMHFKQNRMAHATEVLQIIKKNKLKYKELPNRIFYNDKIKKEDFPIFRGFSIIIQLLIK